MSVHNHGPAEGEGLSCPERTTSAGVTVGSCLDRKYPEVELFAARMLQELADNSGKGDQAGWLSMSLKEAWAEIAWHNAKMATAIKLHQWDLVRELCADVANGAMMLDDIVAKYGGIEP
jgi:hypothetical protein